LLPSNTGFENLEKEGFTMFKKSSKLNHVSYAIRGPILEEVQKLEQTGQSITKLHIGNPAPFGFQAPPAVLHKLQQTLEYAQGYSDFRGCAEACSAIASYYRRLGIHGVSENHVYTGNGVSELILMSMQALLNAGDEVLVPAPDYPLWTAAVTLGGGTPVHYCCDETADWAPDLADMEAKISSRTKAIVIINPNNPTGAVYSRAVLQGIVDLAAKHQLAVFSDEIYETIVFDDAEHIPTASLCDDVFCVTLSGLSKSHFLAGYRAGWMVVSGALETGLDYMQGLNMLASMRLCSNVPAQHTIGAVMEHRNQYRDEFPREQLTRQRDLVWQKLNAIPGISCSKPQGAFYAFPKMDCKRLGIHSDEQFALDLLRKKRILIVQGTGFNWPDPDHFRIVFLLNEQDLGASLDELGDFLQSYCQQSSIASPKTAALSR